MKLKNWYKFFFHFFSFHIIKMKQKSLYFGENGITKNSFHKDKRPVNKVDLKRNVSSDKESYGKRCIHKSNVFPAPLCIKLPK